MPLDRSILNAKHIVLPAYQQIEFYLVGCGGTGSWLAPSLCRIARTVNYPRFIAGSSLYDSNAPYYWSPYVLVGNWR